MPNFQIRSAQKMPRIRTVPKAVAEIQQNDPNTFITVAIMRRWIKQGFVKVIPGTRAYQLIDLDQVEEFIASSARV